MIEKLPKITVFLRVRRDRSVQERPKHSLKEMSGSTLVLATGVMLWVSLFLILSGLVFTSMGCATHAQLASDYQQAVREAAPEPALSHEFVFLVDGLNRQTLREELEAGRLPNLRAFFFGASKRPPRIASAVAPVPSLTYPSLASWLTSAPVASHGIFGNQLESHGLTFNLESVVDRQEFSRRIGAFTVFSRLEGLGQQSLNLSYVNQLGASIQASVDPAVALAAAQDQHDELDESALRGLFETLSQRPAREWPRFQWIHLVSFDHEAHASGPQSEAARTNLRRIDEGLGPVFAALLKAERQGVPIRVLFSADHGMVPVKRRASLPAGWVPMGRAAFASSQVAQESIESVAALPGVEGVVARQDQSLVVVRGSKKTRVLLSRGECAGALQILVDGRCPDVARRPHGLSRAAWSGLLEYFSAKDAPQALAFAAKDITFDANELGSHGGLSDEEMYAPLLHRNWPGVGEVNPVHQLLAWVGPSGARDFSAASGLVGSQPPAEPHRTALELTTVALSETFSGAASEVALGARIGVRPKLSKHWTGVAEYGFLRMNHSVRAGSAYWLGEKSFLGLSASMGQIWQPGWNATLDFETKARLIALGDTDVLIGGSVGLISEGGFRAGGELAWENYFTFRDLGGVRLRFDQMSPGPAGSARGLAVRRLLGIELYYRFGG